MTATNVKVDMRAEHWVMIVQLTVIAMLLVVVFFRLKVTPSDVLEQLQGIKTEVQLLTSTVDNLPLRVDRWTATDERAFQEMLFRENPKLKRPEYYFGHQHDKGSNNGK